MYDMPAAMRKMNPTKSCPIMLKWCGHCDSSACTPVPIWSGAPYRAREVEKAPSNSTVKPIKKRNRLVGGWRSKRPGVTDAKAECGVVRPRCEERLGPTGIIVPARKRQKVRYGPTTLPLRQADEEETAGFEPAPSAFSFIGSRFRSSDLWVAQFQRDCVCQREIK